MRWRQGILAAKNYIERHGSLELVQRDARIDNYPLGQWLNRCREDHRAGDLSSDRKSELESLPGWTWGRHEQHWLDGITSLRRYVDDHGHASPTQHTVSDGFDLGWWVTSTRRRHRLGTLPAEWAEALETLPGWQWDPLEAQWQRGLSALMSYVDLHGSADPGRGTQVDDYRVRDWVRAQRDAFKKGRLPALRVAQLEGLRGWRWT